MDIKLRMKRIEKKLKVKALRIEKFLAMFKERECLELKNPKATRWVMVLADASEPGRFRHQTFCDSGMLGHSTFNTPEAAIADAVSLGYKRLDSGILDKIATTSSWAKGSAINDLYAKLNSRQINFEQFKREIIALEEQYA